MQKQLRDEFHYRLSCNDVVPGYMCFHDQSFQTISFTVMLHDLPLVRTHAHAQCSTRLPSAMSCAVSSAQQKSTANRSAGQQFLGSTIDSQQHYQFVLTASAYLQLLSGERPADSYQPNCLLRNVSATSS